MVVKRLSPLLFSLLVQEITSKIRSRGGYGIQLTPDMVELSILLFADDIVSTFSLPYMTEISVVIRQ